VDIAFPDAGVWEVVVLCDPALRRSGKDETLFRLDAEVGGVGSAAKTVFAHAGKNPDSVESAVSLWNSGVTFDARPQLLVNGENGFLRRGEVRVIPGVSAMLSLPRVEPDSDALYLSVSGPEDPSASISFYLYYLDSATGQWKQVEAGHSSPARSGHVVIADPSPGQYVAYVDAVGVGKTGTTFRWLALSTRPGEPAGSYAPSGLSTLKWDAGATLTVNTKAPAQPGVPPEQYLVVWDAADSALRSVVPIVTEAQGASLLVTYVEGTRIGDTVYTTFRAWDRATMRPVDACVQVNGTWYQMSEGYAVVELDHAELVDLQIRAEYPGMISWTNTPDT